MKRTYRIALLLLLLAGVALLSLYFTLRGGALNQRILGFALARLNKSLNGEVQVKALAGDPLSRLKLSGLSLRDAEGRLVASAEEMSLIRESGFFRIGELKLVIRGARLVLEKTDGGWNFSGLKKPKTVAIKRAAAFPRLGFHILIEDSKLELVRPGADPIHAFIRRAEGSGATLLHEIRLDLEETMARVQEPPLGINQLSASAVFASTPEGWKLKFENGKLITASSAVELESAAYDTESSEFSAELSRIEISPRTLALFWPGHPLKSPLSGSASLHGDLSRVNLEAQIKAGEGSLKAEGFYLVNRGRLELSGQMKDFSLQETLVQEVLVSGLTGRFKLSYQPGRKSALNKQEPEESGKEEPEAEAEEGEENKAEKPQASPRIFTASLELSGFSYPGLNSLPLEAELELRGQEFSASLYSHSPGAGMAGLVEGSLDAPRPVYVRAQLYELNPSVVGPGFPRGRLSGQFEFSGSGTSFAEFQGQGHFSLERGELESVEVGRAEVNFKLAEGRLELATGKTVIYGANVSGQGNLVLTDPSLPYNFSLQVLLEDPAYLEKLTGGEVSISRMSASLKLQGEKDKWNALLSGEARELEAEAAKAGSADFTANLEGRGSASAGGELTCLLKTVDLKAARDSGLELPRFDLWTFVKLKPGSLASLSAAYEMKTASLSSDFSFRSKGELAWSKAKKEWRLGLEELAFKLMGQSWSLPSPAGARGRDGEVSVDGFRLKSEEQTVSLEGVVWGPRLDFNIASENLELGPWAARFYPGDTVEGEFSGKLAVEGAPASPRVGGELSVSGLRIGQTRLESIESGLSLHRGRLDFNLTALSPDAGSFRAEGHVPVSFSLSPFKLGVLKNEQMELRVEEGRIPAALLGFLIPWVQETKGQLLLTALIQGTPAAPQWNGRVDVEEVGFKVPEWGFIVEGLHGYAVIEDNRLTIPVLVARREGGKLRLKGGLTLSGFSVSELDLYFKARDYRFMNTPDIQAVLDAKIKIKGELEAPEVKGTVKFEELKYRPPLLLTYQGVSWESEDPTIVIKGEEKPAPEPSAFLDRSDIDIQIRIPDTGVLRNQELNVRFGGELSLRKPPGAFFLIVGKVESKDGWLVFQGKPFRVERGVFEFPAIPVIDPSLDILASYRVPNYTTYIHIGGYLSGPTLELYSDPPLDPADVLAVILFGKPSSELAEGQRESLAGTGGQLVAGYAAAGLANSLSQTLNIDTMIIQPGESAESSAVGFGKYLNERLYFFYYHRFGEEAAEEFKLRYELDKNISIEAGQTGEGEGVIDIYYRKPY